MGDTALLPVWRFDGAHFTPIDVRAGVTDGTWTEVVRGSFREGDALVTSASVDRSGRSQSVAR